MEARLAPVLHAGLIVVAPNRQRNFLNSAEPKVREESFPAFFARTAEPEARNARQGKQEQQLAGFKILRLNLPVVAPAAPQPRPAPPGPAGTASAPA